MDISDLLEGDRVWSEDRLYLGRQPNGVVYDWDEESTQVFVKYWDGDIDSIFFSDMEYNYVNHTLGFIIGDPINLYRNATHYSVNGSRVWMWCKQEG